MLKIEKVREVEAEMVLRMPREGAQVEEWREEGMVHSFEAMEERRGELEVQEV